jgi:beta-glucosidase/6-phospho-beta-glucosidase/beta-galactosidase
MLISLYYKERTPLIKNKIKVTANIIRQSLPLEAAQAVGGWKSRSIVEKIYTDDAPDELNRSAVEYVGELFEKK